MVAAGVVEPANTEWASPVVFALKKDGTLRFCIDYRRLNVVAVRDAYPIPRMDDCIDLIGDANIFTTLDCNSGYWQIPVAPEDRDKTAFILHEGLYRFTCMPLRLENAPGTFQRAADIILAQVKCKFALVYLDDIIVYRDTVSGHLDQFRKVMSLLMHAGLTLNLNSVSSSNVASTT